MNKQSSSVHQPTTAGFTLIEVLVSLALFMVVITIAVGSLMVLIDANAKLRTTQSLMNNVSFTLDSMTREIRQGSQYTCSQENNDNGLRLEQSVDDEQGSQPGNNLTKDCLNPRSAFAFTETDSSLAIQCDDDGLMRRIGYRIGSHNNDNGSIERNICGDGWQPVTPPEVDITRLDFIVQHADGSDSRSPRVMILVEGEAGTYEAINTSFAIQTAVTQRELDL